MEVSELYPLILSYALEIWKSTIVIILAQQNQTWQTRHLVLRI